MQWSESPNEPARETPHRGRRMRSSFRHSARRLKPTSTGTSSSRVRSGARPPLANRIRGPHLLKRHPIPISLVGQGRIGIPIADHHPLGRQGRLDYPANQFRPRRGKQKQRRPSQGRLRWIEHEAANSFAQPRAARLTGLRDGDTQSDSLPANHRAHADLPLPSGPSIVMNIAKPCLERDGNGCVRSLSRRPTPTPGPAEGCAPGAKAPDPGYAIPGCNARPDGAADGGCKDSAD